LILWPRNLSCDYSYNQIPLFRGTFDGWGDWATLLAVLTCLAAAALAAASYRRRPSVFFFIALFFIALAPVANIALLVGTIRADRFLYLPAVGFIGCSVWAIHAAVERLNTRWPGSPITPTRVFGLLCLALVVQTYARNSDWENSRTLFESAVVVSPRSYKAHLNLAGSLYANLERAIAEGERSLAILKSLPPDRDEDAGAYGDIASIFRAKGDTLRQGEPPGSAAMSRQWYQKALEILLHGAAVDRERSAKLQQLNREAGRPPQGFGTAGVYRELGTVYLRLGEPQKAMEAVEYGSFLNPDGEIFHLLSEAYTALHDRNNAAIALMEGLLVQPDRAGAAAELVDLYQQEPSGCAVNQDGLNLECPQVHDNLCTAARRAGDLFDRRGQHGVAERTRDTAVRRLGCPPQ
jgi:protein O-mannosyl-transferase